MDRPTQAALLQRIFLHLDAGTTDMSAAPFLNPVSSYTSAARVADERAVLFRQEPLLVGLSTDAPARGSWFTQEDGEVPLLVTRGDSGVLHAFANVCRHRGARVAEGRGDGPGRFTCPWHGWTYDDRGRVLSQPCREGFPGMDENAGSLLRLPVAERHGLIFVRPTAGEEIDVDAHLDGAERELAPFDLARHVPFARRRLERRLNWKLVIDTFLEAYHVPALHERTLSPAILGSPALWDAFGRGGRMIAVRRSVTKVRDLPEAERDLLDHAVILYLLFPNTILIHQRDHVEVVQAWPGFSGPDSSDIVFALYTPGPIANEKARRHFQTNFDLLVGVIDDEDLTIGQQVQRGFHSGAHPEVVYGRNEPGLAHFHASIRAKLDGRTA